MFTTCFVDMSHNVILVCETHSDTLKNIQKKLHRSMQHDCPHNGANNSLVLLMMIGWNNCCFREGEFCRFQYNNGRITFQDTAKQLHLQYNYQSCHLQYKFQYNKRDVAFRNTATKLNLQYKDHKVLNSVVTCNALASALPYLQFFVITSTFTEIAESAILNCNTVIECCKKSIS